MEYIKDWRIWVLAIIILIITRFPIFGEEIEFETLEKKSDQIEFKFDDIEFEWKINKFKTKWKANERFNVCHYFIADDINEYRNLVIFTLDF